jgi:hypothetical protein
MLLPPHSRLQQQHSGTHNNVSKHVRLRLQHQQAAVMVADMAHQANGMLGWTLQQQMQLHVDLHAVQCLSCCSEETCQLSM